MKHKFKLFLITVLFLLAFTFPKISSAQDGNVSPKEEILKAKVVKVIEDGMVDNNPYQKVRIAVFVDKENFTETTIEHGGKLSISENQKVKEGDIVVINKVSFPNGDIEYQIIDKYRLNEVLMVGVIFFILVILLSRWKGFGSFVGMFISLLVIVGYIVPQIINGGDPLFVGIIGSLIILVTSIYLAHGFSKQTSVAVLSTFLTLVIAGILSVLFVNVTNLTGFGSEDIYSLQFGVQTANINFKGLLLAGMIIGFLGVLDDVTTSLSATVFELKKQNPNLTFSKLVKSSLNIGREHVSSLVNTLILAYAGASLPIFIFIVLNPQNHPLWFILNSEMISQEIVRTLSGSMGLLFAVPITTFMAALAVSKRKV